MDDAVIAVVGSITAPATVYSYGTAGFRARGELLDGVFVRCGMLSALRSVALTGAREEAPVIGAVITASHNPIEDNGVKMVDSDGGMLARAWELYASELAAALTPELVLSALKSIAEREGVAWPVLKPSRVYVAMDTRPSSPHLKSCFVAGAQALGATVTDCGLLTTPQLHHIVRMVNLGGRYASAYGSEDGYYRMLAEAYEEILAADAMIDAPIPSASERGPLVLDCANGIGGPKAALLAAVFSQLVHFELRNTGGSPAEAARLNDGVGAEHAQKGRLPPAGFTPGVDNLRRCASLDGDADRLVYHYFTADGVWKLLDGDKIAALAAAFLSAQLGDLGLPITGVPNHPHDCHACAGDAPPLPVESTGPRPISVGVVQTAYANGASTHYIRETLGLPVPLAKTGVKFVHHAAQEYDIGVYFEANGHGTVLFHPEFVTLLQGMPMHHAPPKQQLAHRRLSAAIRLINQAIGDALSDAMFVEAVLAMKGWSISDWDAIYTDLPSRQAKLAVRDRTALRTVEDETRLTAPAALQEAIDELVAKYPQGRAFVRPSGTEDVVRVYAEAATQDAADELAHLITLAAHRHGGGVGPEPTR